LRGRLRRFPTVVRAAQRQPRKRPSAVAALPQALTLLAEDAFHPKLRTHKLKEKLQGSWAASAGSDRRIIFDFVLQDEAEAILLLTIGTHEEVYLNSRHPRPCRG